MVTDGAQFSGCADEQDFKIKYLNKMKAASDRKHRFFCIETEETNAGFPDVMEVITGAVNYTRFYEFKFSDRYGKIKFQPSQPSFYRRNSELGVTVIAYNRRTGNVHTFNANDIFICGSLYEINIKAEVDLTKVERSL